MSQSSKSIVRSTPKPGGKPYNQIVCVFPPGSIKNFVPLPASADLQVVVVRPVQNQVCNLELRRRRRRLRDILEPSSPGRYFYSLSYHFAKKQLIEAFPVAVQEIYDVSER